MAEKEHPRTPADIRRELDDLTARRAELWRELAEAADPAKSAEISDLNERIEALWSEARRARTRARFGDQESILARARAEERLERHFAKVA